MEGGAVAVLSATADGSGTAALPLPLPGANAIFVAVSGEDGNDAVLAPPSATDPAGSCGSHTFQAKITDGPCECVERTSSRR